MNFLKRPCPDCPFRKNGAIQLAPGRLPGIVETLKSDFNFFYCHETTDGEEREDEDGGYEPTGNESLCMGALSFMHGHHGQLPIVARLGLRSGDLSGKDIQATVRLIKRPCDVE